MTRPSARTTVRPEHVLAHRAVADRRGARRPRRRHAANRGVGAGIDPEGDAGVGQRLVELAVRDAGLDLAVEIVGADAQHAIHARQINRDAALDGVDVPFERGPDAERDDRRTMHVRQTNDGADLLGVRRKHDDVRQSWDMPRFAVTVVFDLRCIGRASIAEQRVQVCREGRAGRI